jgi:hypothetical protein
MSDSDLEARVPTFVDPQSGLHTAAIAVISEEEFAWAQVVIPELAAYSDYQDWLDCREGFQIGLSASGVDVKMVSVVLSPFLAWCRLTGAAAGERVLDTFAAILLLLRRPPVPHALALVRRDEFETYAGVVGAFAPHADFEAWARHRAAAQKRIAELGGKTESLPVRISDFVEWGKCLGQQTSESALDRYAALVLEFLIEAEKSS